MLTSLLSVLFLGLWPLNSTPSVDSTVLQGMLIAPPAGQVTIADYLTASGVLVMDADSGQSLYAKYGDVKRPMASITKLMTALVIVEHHELDEYVTIPKGIQGVVGNKAYLTEGEKFTVGDMLSALLIASANDAAHVLAVHHSGSMPAFVAKMNERATQLGLQDTSYANPSGLDDEQQYSTPRDIAVLTRYALGHPELASRMRQRWDSIYSIEGSEIGLSHTHALLHSGSGDVLADKTGTTSAAGQCLVSLVEHNGRRLIVVLLRSAERYADMQTILAALQSSLV